MSHTLANTMLSYVRARRRSIQFYHQMARRFPADASRYAVERKRALREACFYLRWAAEELARADDSEVTRDYRNFARVPMVEAVQP